MSETGAGTVQETAGADPVSERQRRIQGNVLINVVIVHFIKVFIVLQHLDLLFTSNHRAQVPKCIK